MDVVFFNPTSFLHIIYIGTPWSEVGRLLMRLMLDLRYTLVRLSTYKHGPSELLQVENKYSSEESWDRYA